MSMNHKQQRFAEEYLVDLNATQAAIRAGYSARSDKQGSRLMKNDDIANYLKGMMDERAERAKAEAARASGESAMIAYADIGAYAGLIGDQEIAAALEALSPAQRAAIKEIKTDARGRVQIKLYDKQRELQNIIRREGNIASQQEQDRIVAILEARLANHSSHSDDPETEDQAFPACDEGAWK